MTERERKRLDELLIKKEAEEKADKEFFSQVRKRKAEVLKVLKEDEPNHYEQELRNIAYEYGITVENLLLYIKSEQQINFYKRTHP